MTEDSGVSTKADDEPESQSIRVVVRFRPINKREKKEDAKGGVPKLPLNFEQKGDQGSISLVGTTSSKPHQFVFDHVLGPDTTQEQAFNAIGEQLCDHVLSGYNTTLFVYGQTGSGKTYSMYGDEKDPGNPMSMGVIPRAVCYLFDEIEQNPNIVDARVKVSFLEIYQEKLKDLLSPGKMDLRIRLQRSGETWVTNLSEHTVTNLLDVLQLIELATSYRTKAETDMNATSSRSHMLMTMYCALRMADGSARTGKVNFADLAGSEKVRKTGATGALLDEAKAINLSLTVLGQVISALASGKSRHVPYRDSALTHVLSDSLGGNCRTTLAVCASPHAFNREETINTLRFGMRCKLIKNTVKVNRVYSNAELMAIVTKLRETIAELKKKCRKYKKIAAKAKKSGVDVEDVSDDEAPAPKKLAPPKMISHGGSAGGGSDAFSSVRSGDHSSSHSRVDTSMSEISVMDDDERARLERRIQHLTEENQDLKDEVQDLRYNAVTGDESLHALESDLAKAKEQITKLTTQNADLEIKVKELKEHAEFADDANLKLAHAFTTLKDMFQAEQKRLKELQEAKIRQSEKMYERMKKMRAKAKSAVSSKKGADQEVEELGRKIEETNAMLKVESERAEQLKGQLMEASRKFNESEGKYRAEKKRRGEAELEIKKLSDKLDDLETRMIEERTNFKVKEQTLMDEIRSRTEKFQAENHELKKILADRGRLAKTLSMRGTTMFDGITQQGSGDLVSGGDASGSSSPPGPSGSKSVGIFDSTPGAGRSNTALMMAGFGRGGAIAHSSSLRRASMISTADSVYSAEELADKEDQLLRQSTYLTEMARKRRTQRKELAAAASDVSKESPLEAGEKPMKKKPKLGAASSEATSSTSSFRKYDDFIDDEASTMTDIAIEAKKNQMQERMTVLKKKLENLRNEDYDSFKDENAKLQDLLEIATCEDELRQLRARYRKLLKLEKRAKAVKMRREERSMSLKDLADSAEMTPVATTPVPEEDDDAFLREFETEPSIMQQSSFGADIAIELDLSRQFSKIVDEALDRSDIDEESVAFRSALPGIASPASRKRRKKRASRPRSVDFK